MKNKEQSFAQILASPEHAANHAQLQKEINEPFKIDYSEFSKSPEEKAVTRAIAQSWKVKRRI